MNDTQQTSNGYSWGTEHRYNYWGIEEYITLGGRKRCTRTVVTVRRESDADAIAGALNSAYATGIVQGREDAGRDMLRSMGTATAEDTRAAEPQLATSYQISSKTGMRHKVDGPMPDSDTAVRMWQGKELPLTVCGRRVQPVNFYEAGEEHSNPRYRCSGCFGEPPADWPKGKTFGELTPAERTAAIKRASAKTQAELQANADAIGKVMEGDDS